MNFEGKSNDIAPSPSSVNEANVPSGFILKLFQMVNGAPDEVITVSSPAFEAKKKLYPKSVAWFRL
jgi:hypothetical protein